MNDASPCFHCGSHSHTIEACPVRAKGKPQTPTGRYAAFRAGVKMPPDFGSTWEDPDRLRFSGRKGGRARE